MSQCPHPQPVLARLASIAVALLSTRLVRNDQVLAAECSALSFAAPRAFGVGTYPQSVTVDDFDGDNNADLVVANAGSGNVSVLLGQGDGTFQAAVNYAAGTNPQFVAVGDFRSVGRSELAVANLLSGNISILLAQGDGSFQSAVNFAVRTNPQSVAVGDFNGDGKPDLVTANVNSAIVSVILNTCASNPISLAAVRSTPTFVISWPFPSTGFALESTTGLNPANWQPASGVPADNNGRKEVTVPLSQQQRYFRLRQP